MRRTVELLSAGDSGVIAGVGYYPGNSGVLQGDESAGVAGERAGGQRIKEYKNCSLK